MGRPTNRELHASHLAAARAVADLAPGAASADLGPWFVYDSAVGNQEFNVALVRGRVRDPGTALNEAACWFAARGEGFRLALRSDADAGLIAAARERGFHEWWREPAMVLWPLLEPPRTPPELRIAEVRDASSLALFEAMDTDQGRAPDWSIARQAMELPGVRLYVGFVGRRAVARAMGMLHGRMVRIANVYVRQEWRRRGLGAAITAAAICGGMQLGAQAACLEATDMGYPVYRRMGFEHRYDMVALRLPEVGSS